MKSYALSVHESASQPSSTITDAAPSYSELVHRLKLVTVAIDFLLGHPDLKASDRELGLSFLRQTILFGKQTDKSTARQQAHGVRNLNRGTGRHEKTLQRARGRLLRAGFMRVLSEPGDRRGNAYAPDFDFIEQQVEKMRTKERIAPPHPGAKCSPHQSYPSGSNCQNAAQLARSPIQRQKQKSESETKQTPPAAPWKSVLVEDHDIDCMQAHLVAITEGYPNSNFGPPSRATARDMIGAARLSNPDTTPEYAATFLAAKFAKRKPFPYENGLRRFGGMIVAVKEDFPEWVKTRARACTACGCPRLNAFGNCAACCRSPELAARFAAERRGQGASGHDGQLCGAP